MPLAEETKRHTSKRKTEVRGAKLGGHMERGIAVDIHLTSDAGVISTSHLWELNG